MRCVCVHVCVSLCVNVSVCVSVHNEWPLLMSPTPLSSYTVSTLYIIHVNSHPCLCRVLR